MPNASNRKALLALIQEHAEAARDEERASGALTREHAEDALVHEHASGAAARGVLTALGLRQRRKECKRRRAELAVVSAQQP